MQWPRCQHENPAGQKFCGECGARLAAGCPSCGSSNPPSQKFCGECGAPLTPGDVPKFASPQTYTPKHLAEKILTSKAALEGERKQVTVLFADLKGSMELLADRDPEERRARFSIQCSRAHDGGRPSLRGHGEPGNGRRNHGALRRAAGPRRPRRADVLCRAPDAGTGQSVRRGGVARTA
jgi:hypothetical protein